MLVFKLIDLLKTLLPKLIISVGIILSVWLVMYGVPSYLSFVMYLISLWLSNITLCSFTIDKDYDIIEQEQQNLAYYIYLTCSLLCMYVVTIVLNLTDNMPVDTVRYVPLSIVYIMLVVVAVLRLNVKYNRYINYK